MGIDTVGAVFTRGVLIDVAGSRASRCCGDDYEMTVADMRTGPATQATPAVKEGDAVIVHTGWGLLSARTTRAT